MVLSKIRKCFWSFTHHSPFSFHEFTILLKSKLIFGAISVLCFPGNSLIWFPNIQLSYTISGWSSANQLRLFYIQSLGCFEGQASRQKRKLGEFKLSFKISIICSNFFGNRSIILNFSVIVWRISRSISETNKFVLNYFFNAGNFHKHWLSIYKSLLYTFTVSCSSS